MNNHNYSIVDSKGYLLCEIKTQPTNANFDDNAKLFIVDLLPVIAKQYGVEKAFYADI
tara:strand:- start:245 stop:418 length:174 start_codon:yes stop_codon:yes gene_type:complete